ncbi:MAG TPA: phenylalanine--tRNA ligase subunit alpha [Nitrososphaerales archaeon]|nr:phenylalanine--tRNA ligase subunit alpha [Nitrososphaerales archaeon]
MTGVRITSSPGESERDFSSTLHPLEQKILASLAVTGPASFEALVGATSLNEDQVRRALQWLVSKGFVEVTETTKSSLKVEENPSELVLLDRLEGSKSGIPLKVLRESFTSESEFSAAFGRARGARWVKIEGSPDQTVKLDVPAGAEGLRTLIRTISAGGSEDDLSAEQVRLVQDLLKRGILSRVETKVTSISITDSGRAASTPSSSVETIDKLTPDILSTGRWRGKSLRAIDVEAKAPVVFAGRRHPVRDFIKEVRETYVSMGFIELQGESVHPAFWNFDALYIPQDHPGREMQDTFYLKGMSDHKMKRQGEVANVAAAHETGWKTGSRGWGYTWRIEEARRLVLRTHNTVLTVKAMSEMGGKETRAFAVSKVYRNENLDYKHLAEFYQMDGIMVGGGLNVRHLMGFLKEFYKKLGMADVKLWPTYFPYTEPSLEVVGYSRAAGDWIELSGSGVFRPEVTEPLGVKVPVLAWGPGIERLMLMRLGLDDVRALYGTDLSWLRNRVELASSKN